MPAGRHVRRAGRVDGRAGAAAARGGCWRWCSSWRPATTAVLSLDATIVLLTPIVFATAARLPANSAPARVRVLAPGQLGLAAAARVEPDQPARVSPQRAVVRAVRRADGAALAVALAVEWLVLPGRSPAICGARATRPRRSRGGRLPAFALCGGGGDAGRLRARARRSGSRPCGWRRPARSCSGACRPRAQGAGARGRADAAGVRARPGDRRARPPATTGCRARSARSCPAARAAGAARGRRRSARSPPTWSTTCPATLIILPVVAASGPGAVLAMLVGVNVGPNLTYVGSLATLLWRRIVHAHERGDRHRRVHAARRADGAGDAAGFDARLWLALQVL